MSKFFVCCDKCFEKIAKNSPKAARIWMDLCRLKVENGQNFTLRSLDFPELRTLELLGYIVSTEIFIGITIKVKGHCLTEEGQDLFCLTIGSHNGN